MNHAITLLDLLLFFGAICGLIACAIGLLMVMASAMSDAGDDGASGNGCMIFVAGVVVLVGATFLLVTR